MSRAMVTTNVGLGRCTRAVTDLQHQGAAELAALIRDRKLSSTKLLEPYLLRIAKHNGALNAVVSLDEERARKAARAADE